MKANLSVASKQSLIAATKQSLQSWLHSPITFASNIMGQKVTHAHFVHLSHCCIAFMFMAISANNSVLLTIIGLVWFLTSLASAKKGGLK